MAVHASLQGGVMPHEPTHILGCKARKTTPRLRWQGEEGQRRCCDAVSLPAESYLPRRCCSVLDATSANQAGGDKVENEAREGTWLGDGTRPIMRRRQLLDMGRIRLLQPLPVSFELSRATRLWHTASLGADSARVMSSVA
jgi:hypothetical protein